jgi:hypothetical protein
MRPFNAFHLPDDLISAASSTNRENTGFMIGLPVTSEHICIPLTVWKGVTGYRASPKI